MALSGLWRKTAVRKETGTQEKDGRDVNPAVTCPCPAGQSETELKSRGLAWGQ